MTDGRGADSEVTDPPPLPSGDAAQPTYVLIPGAGGSAWYWHRLVHELQRRGSVAIPIELPAADDRAGLQEYAESVVEGIGGRTGLVVVAQSLGGFVAPLVCERAAVELLVLLNAMIPAPGESAGDWWANTDQATERAQQATREGRTLGDDFDLFEDFLHDLSPDVTAELLDRGETPQSGTPLAQPAPFLTWPAVPTRVLVGQDDRLFPAEFQRRIAEQRLGITPDEIPGGHLLALSQPIRLADKLDAYWSGLTHNST